MKKANINAYESPLPPALTNVLWADKDEATGDLKVIHRFKNGEWEPYMVSVDYMQPEDDNLSELVVLSTKDGTLKYKAFKREVNINGETKLDILYCFYDEGWILTDTTGYDYPGYHTMNGGSLRNLTYGIKYGFTNKSSSSLSFENFLYHDAVILKGNIDHILTISMYASLASKTWQISLTMISQGDIEWAFNNLTYTELSSNEYDLCLIEGIVVATKTKK